MSKTWVDALFLRLQSIYKSRWEKDYPDEKSVVLGKMDWGMALSGVTGDQVRRALERCRDELPWPPNMAEFRQLCLGLDSASEEEAYQAFSKRDWSHALAKQVYDKIGDWNVRNLLTSQERKEFSRVYALVKMQISSPEPQKDRIEKIGPISRIANAISSAFKGVPATVVATQVIASPDGLESELNGIGENGHSQLSPEGKFVQKMGNIQRLIEKANPHLRKGEVLKISLNLYNEKTKEHPRQDKVLILSMIEDQLLKTYQKAENNACEE